MSRAKVIPSGSVNVYVNGKPFGRCVGFTFKSATAKREIHGIDSLDPYELAATTASISGSMTIVRTVADGGAEGAGMTVTYEDLPREKYFSIMLVDRGANDTVLFQADECSVSSQSWNVPAKGVVTGTVEWSAISWSNEVKPLGISFA